MSPQESTDQLYLSGYMELPSWQAFEGSRTSNSSETSISSFDSMPPLSPIHREVPIQQRLHEAGYRSFTCGPSLDSHTEESPARSEDLPPKGYAFSSPSRKVRFVREAEPTATNDPLLYQPGIPLLDPRLTSRRCWEGALLPQPRPESGCLPVFS